MNKLLCFLLPYLLDEQIALLLTSLLVGAGGIAAASKSSAWPRTSSKTSFWLDPSSGILIFFYLRGDTITTLPQEPHLVGAGTSGESSTGSGTASSPSSLNVEGSYVPRLAIGNGDGRERTKPGLQ